MLAAGECTGHLLTHPQSVVTSDLVWCPETEGDFAEWRYLM